MVNAIVNIPSTASAINHITNQMIKMHQLKKKVYADLIDFLGDALQEKTAICAHNAKFDMDFLSQTLMRLGYNAKIHYVDYTFVVHRGMIKGLINYKQDTVAIRFLVYTMQMHIEPKLMLKYVVVFLKTLRNNRERPRKK